MTFRDVQRAYDALLPPERIPQCERCGALLENDDVSLCATCEELETTEDSP